MPKYLVIVESPAKEKTISKFLGPDYIIKSSYGHIRDLPGKELGVDIEKDFEPRYVVTPKGKKIVPQLKAYSKTADIVYLATDYDREGEAIAWHLKEALGLTDKKASRITFHEITKEALVSAVKNPRALDVNLVDSQQARRVLDRLVGYKLSPLLWRKVRSGLSAGRVQSVAVRMICEREEEIKSFKPQEYWSIKANLEKLKDDKMPFVAALVSQAGKKVDKLSIENESQATKILSSLKGADYEVTKIDRKDRRRSPFAPYTTSTLQMDASRRLGFSAKKTMMVAQKLYEGMGLGGEDAVGLITYMRTDSLNIAQSAQKEAQEYITKKFTKKALPEKPRIYKTKAKGAQEAHEAIRPTLVAREPEKVKGYLTADELKLYDLIWRRFLASQMADAIFDTITAEITAGVYGFRANGRVLKVAGFLDVYGFTQENDEAADEEGRLPDLALNEKLNLIKLLQEQHFTEPPPRYNEASLIKALEEKGIGRPSTYAPTINTILERLYVRLETKRFYPTDLGVVVNEILVKNFPEVVDVNFTAGVEEKFDLIAEGKYKWREVVKEFYIPFEKDLAAAEKNLVRQKVAPEKTNEVCPKCGLPMVLRDSRRGKFIACSGFPKCKTTFSLDKEGNKVIRPEPEKTEFKCDKCGSIMFKRVSKRGPFLACSAFPKCRNIKKVPEQDSDALNAPDKEINAKS